MKDYSLRNEKSKLIQATATSLHEHITELFDNGYDQGYADATIALAHEENDRAYQKGLEDAWEAARKITKMNLFVKGEIFGTVISSQIAENNTAQEAISKIKEYEEQQKQDTEIKVGDEVYTKISDLTFIVTRIITKKHMDNTVKRYEGICTDGACYDNIPEDIVKTGRHFDQIAEVLAEMRGDKE